MKINIGERFKNIFTNNIIESEQTFLYMGIKYLV